MPKVVIDIPARFMPTITELATEKYDIDTTNLTNAQIATRVVLKLVREEVRNQKLIDAETQSRVATMELVNQERAALEATRITVETDIENIVETV